MNIVLDWREGTPHKEKSKTDQLIAIMDVCKTCEALFISLDGMTVDDPECEPPTEPMRRRASSMRLRCQEESPLSSTTRVTDGHAQNPTSKVLTF
jgi:hypothetical protein